MASQDKIDAAFEALGGLVAQAGGEGDEALDVVKDELAALRAPRNDTLDVDALNAQANALYDVAWHRGYRAGEERKTSELVEHYGKDSRGLAVQMLDSALSAGDEWAQWALAHYARRLLGQTPGSALTSYAKPLVLLDRALGRVAGGKTDVAVLREARDALAAVDGGVMADPADNHDPEAQAALMERVRGLGLPVLGPVDPGLTHAPAGVALSVPFTSKRLSPLAEDGYSLCPSGRGSVIVEVRPPGYWRARRVGTSTHREWVDVDG
jgi:hypothetical protein